MYGAVLVDYVIAYIVWSVYIMCLPGFGWQEQWDAGWGRQSADWDGSAHPSTGDRATESAGHLWQDSSERDRVGWSVHVFFGEHILFRTSLPKCLCEIDACPLPLCLLLLSYQMYLWCLSLILVLTFLGFFSLLPFLVLLSLSPWVNLFAVGVTGC